MTDAAEVGCRKDQRLEDFKRAVMNEIELDFSWYCREKPRTRQEMEKWWDKRGQLVDALLANKTVSHGILCITTSRNCLSRNSLRH